MAREENIKRIELGFSTCGLSMSRKIYYACKAIGVKAHGGDYLGTGKHICEFSVSEEDADKFVEYLKENNNTLAIDTAYIHCSRMFGDNNIFWRAEFSRIR